MILLLKNKLDFKLVNLCLIVLIFFLLYQTGSLWITIFSKLVSIIIPFFFAFIIAYAFNPLLRWFIKKGLPKGLGVFIIVLIILGIIGLVLGVGLPLIANQLSSLFGSIITFFNEISEKLNVNFNDLENTLSSSFNNILADVSKYVSNGALNIIGSSLSIITAIMIALSAAIYLLVDMDKIRKNVFNFVNKRTKKISSYIKILDEEMKKYLGGLLKIAVITLFEYTLGYLIIGHPNALLLGLLACVLVVIPYFGGIFINIVALITAFTISPALFLRTIICVLVYSFLDGYLINPLVYGKSNKMHPLIVIISVFAGGIIFGLFGIVMALPLSIIIVSTIKYFKEDIIDIVEEVKNQKDDEECS